MAKSKTRKHGKTKPPKSLEERSLKYSGTRVIRKMLVGAREGKLHQINFNYSETEEYSMTVAWDGNSVKFSNEDDSLSFTQLLTAGRVFALILRTYAPLQAGQTVPTVHMRTWYCDGMNFTSVTAQELSDAVEETDEEIVFESAFRLV